MLRIFFTSEDVARTRIAPGPDPLWELVLALQMLRPQRGDLLFVGWRREVVARLHRARLGPPLRLLLAINPNVGYFPDFLNPIEAMRGLEDGLEAIRSTPKQQLRRDMHQLASSRRLPSRVRDIMDGDPPTLTALTDAMRACHQLLVRPYRRKIDTAVVRDRSTRVNALAGRGVEGMLRSLGPLARWSADELVMPRHRAQEIHLDGRGLVLIPSYFCVSGPLTMLDPALPPVLIYPVERQPDALPMSETARPEALSALIGVTRAAVLQATIANPGTTEELARRVGVSAASASEHAGVLRRAGLITSFRDRNRMQHQLTSLGVALLDYTATSPSRCPSSAKANW